jgi:hypothetical protein
MNPSSYPSASDGSVRDDESEAYDELDITSLMQSLFLDGKKNRNIPDILCDIRRNIEVHNKLMIKLIQSIDKTPVKAKPESSNQTS